MDSNETIITDAGEYAVVAKICEQGGDAGISLCVGRAADGHCDLIATDNATNWVVGSEDDARSNRDQWTLIAERCGDIDMDAIRAVDADLADWLIDRKAEADATVEQTIGERFPDCHTPELRWRPGERDTLHIESGLTPCSEGEVTVCEFADVADFCDMAGECSPDTMLTDAEWQSVLEFLAHD